jgi:hypothetical protein
VRFGFRRSACLAHRRKKRCQDLGESGTELSRDANLPKRRLWPSDVSEPEWAHIGRLGLGARARLEQRGSPGSAGLNRASSPSPVALAASLCKRKARSDLATNNFNNLQIAKKREQISRAHNTLNQFPHISLLAFEQTSAFLRLRICKQPAEHQFSCVPVLLICKWSRIARK